ncbi:hypothetical protein GCM10011309_25400 [Litorimonas cladophorae]|uniref:Exopolysaccharide biosynthesis protein n=1 Tax=Litorimonas cladophorae TaxID=1220491 RepID=A0A918KRK5_9PROT|nr:exopolysaccharide biosynthesis protein [Litorimonas cladophorae]GGX74183.1 hypothetical protein GCM10011309_25400 [Litorimonas cladophorae]
MNDPQDTETTDQDDTPLQSVMDLIEVAMDGKDSVDLKTVVEAFGNRAFGPVMVLCGLCMMTPLGALPGIPPAFGVIVMVFALQLLFRRRTPWMPEILRKVKIPSKKLSAVQTKVRPVLAKIDGIISPRFSWAVTGPAQVVVSLVAIILSLTFFPLGMVPFGVVAPAAIVLLLGLGITARDGLLILIGLSLSLGVFIGVGALLLNLTGQGAGVF